MSESWTFLTHHSHVLICIWQNRDVRIRDIADVVGITERATQHIVAELEEAGYLHHDKIGRRNHYELTTTLALRHPIESHITLEELMQVVAPKSDDFRSEAVRPDGVRPDAFGAEAARRAAGGGGAG
jgi:Mn-dependent DtxR family transcriptional regulator